MTDNAILLIGRETPHARDAIETHARRLESRDVADAVHVARYETGPARELRGALRGIAADRVYAVPMCVGHTHETTDAVPRALSFLAGEVRYCEPVGHSPAITDLVAERATAHVRAAADATLVVIGFGSSSQPYQRQLTEYHAERIRDQSGFGQVVTCYLLQNPAVECARYNVSNDSAVAVPLFLHRNEATEEQIPAKLELDRGGIEYADPLGTHPGVTDAIHANVERQRVFATSDSQVTDEASLARGERPVATDGEG